MIRHPQKRLKPGALVEVISKEGEFIGRGIYNHHSNIGIRLLTENMSEMLGREFFIISWRPPGRFVKKYLVLEGRRTVTA